MADERIAAFAAQRPIRASSFIVTVYGDAIVPRGGVVWLGNIIDACAAAGISETLVRTAVSRLVAEGRLNGRRVGRRSYYALTPDTRREFDHAAHRIYTAPTPPAAVTTWTLIQCVHPAAQEAVRRLLTPIGFAPAGGNLFIRPEAAPDALAALDVAGLHDACVCFINAAAEPRELPLKRLVADAWNLRQIAESYHTFFLRFAPLRDALLKQGAAQLSPTQALALRLILVHIFRRIALRDPRLPMALLPPGIDGTDARAVFADLYTLLVGPSESLIDSEFVDADGPLPPSRPVIGARLEAMAG